MNNKGRKGCSNFTPQETKLLMELVTRHSDVIENSGDVSVVERKEAWTNVTRQFNKAASTGNRTWHQLKALYENAKREQKSEDSLNNSKLTNKSGKQNNPKKRKRSESKEEELEENSDMDSDEDVEDIMEWNDDIDDISGISSPDVKRHDISSRIKQKAAQAADTDMLYKIKISNAKLERKLMIERHKILVDLFKVKKELLKRKISRLNV